MRYPLPHPVHGVFLPRRPLFVDVVLPSREQPDGRLRSRQGRWTASPAARVRAAFIICIFRGTKSPAGESRGPFRSKVKFARLSWKIAKLRVTARWEARVLREECFRIGMPVSSHSISVANQPSNVQAIIDDDDIANHPKAFPGKETLLLRVMLRRNV